MLFLFIVCLIYLSIVDYKYKEVYDYQLFILALVALCVNGVDFELQRLQDEFIVFSVVFMVQYLFISIYVNIKYFVQVFIKGLDKDKFNSFVFGEGDMFLISIIAMLFNNDGFDYLGFERFIILTMGIWLIYSLVRIIMKKERGEVAFIPFITFGFILSGVY